MRESHQAHWSAFVSDGGDVRKLRAPQWCDYDVRGGICTVCGADVPVVPFGEHSAECLLAVCAEYLMLRGCTVDDWWHVHGRQLCWCRPCSGSRVRLARWSGNADCGVLIVGSVIDTFVLRMAVSLSPGSCG